MSHHQEKAWLGRGGDRFGSSSSNNNKSNRSMGGRGGAAGRGGNRAPPYPLQRGYDLMAKEEDELRRDRGGYSNSSVNGGGSDYYGRPSQDEGYDCRDYYGYHRNNDEGDKHRGRLGGGDSSHYYGPGGDETYDDYPDRHSRANGQVGRKRSASSSNGDDFWECMECNTWNALTVNCCTRCGRDRQRQQRPRSDCRGGWSADGGHEPYNDTSNNQYGPNQGDDDDDLDEFGRKRSDRNVGQTKEGETGRKEKEKNVGRKRREWPPHFDTESAAFIFDGRSGMFYEAESDFFYDPKTKLYYGNKQAKYFRYCDNQDPPFEAVQNVATSDSGAPVDPAVLSRPTSSDRRSLSVNTSGSGGSMIAIKLKTKSLPKKASAGQKKKSKLSTSVSKPPPSSKSADNATLHTDKLQKKHAADMEMWAGRQQEVKTTSKNAGPSDGSQKDAAAAAQSPPRTAKGEPICTLCQRKFATLEKLRYHEKASKLHKENLAKLEEKKKKEESAALEKSSKKASAPTTPGPRPTGKQQYVDRAQQRRNMYEPGAAASAATMAQVATIASSLLPPSAVEVPPPAAAPTVVRPEETLGSSNVGHQMLQKLGWKSGSSLGRPDSGSAVGQKNQEQLTKDWERIEVQANRNGRK